MTTRMCTLALATVLGLATLISEINAGDLVNETNQVIVIQKGVRHPQTGAFTWTHQISLLPGNYANIPAGYWYRVDSHVRDSQLTFTLPGPIEPATGRLYFFLYGNEVRIDVTRQYK